MTRDLETSLWDHVKAGGKAREWIQAALDDGRIESWKQAWRTLEKWTDKGIYNYGVALDLGWIVRGKDRT